MSNLCSSVFRCCRGRRWAVTAFLLLAVAGVGGWLALPWTLGRVLEQALRSLGCANPVVTVRAVGWTRTDVGPLSLGETGTARAEIAVLSVTYSPWELVWHRRVRQVMVQDGRLVLCRDRQGWRVAGMRGPAAAGRETSGGAEMRAWAGQVAPALTGLLLDGVSVRNLQYTVVMADAPAANGPPAAATTVTGTLTALDWQRGAGAAWWLRAQADSATVKAVFGEATVPHLRLCLATGPAAPSVAVDDSSAWHGELRMEGVAARSADRGATWRLADGRLRLPYAWPAAKKTLAVGEVAWGVAGFRSAELAPGCLAARARPDGLGMVVSGELRTGSGGPVVTLETGDVRWSPELGGIASDVRVVLVPCRVALTDAWLKAWRPAVPGLLFSGTVSGRAAVAWRQGRWDGEITGQLRDGQLRWPARKLEVDGLETGPLELIGLAPPRTRMHQTLRFREIRGGSLVIGPGEVTFTLESPTRCFMEKIITQFAGGRLNVYAVTLDAAKPDLDVLMYADGLQLGALLAQFKPGAGGANASLYGRIPVRREQGQWRLLEGFLYAAPGQKSTLQLRDTAWLAAALGGGEAGGPGGVTAKRVEAALADLALRVFTMELTTEADHRVLMRLHVAGKARQDASLPPVDLTVNVRGDLEPILNLGLKMGGEGK